MSASSPLVSPQILTVLNQVYNWKHSSLASYILAASPFVEPGAEAKLDAVKRVAEADHLMAKETLELFATLGESPQLEPHEVFVSELNYLSISYLVTFLKGKLEEQQRDLNIALDLLGVCGEPRELVCRVIEANRRAIEGLSPTSPIRLS